MRALVGVVLLLLCSSCQDIVVGASHHRDGDASASADIGVDDIDSDIDGDIDNGPAPDAAADMEDHSDDFDIVPDQSAPDNTADTLQDGPTQTPCELAGGQCFPGNLACPTPLITPPTSTPCGQTTSPMTCCAGSQPLCGSASCALDQYCLATGCGTPSCVPPDPLCSPLPTGCQDCGCISMPPSCICSKNSSLLFVDCPGA